MYEEMAALAGLAQDLLTFIEEQPAIEGESGTFSACLDRPKLL